MRFFETSASWQRSPLARHGAVLSIACIAMVLGCAGGNREETQPVAAAPAPAKPEMVTPDLPDYTPLVPPGPNAGVFPTNVPAYSHEVHVLGHAVVHDIPGMLAGIRRAAPPMFAGMFQEESLRSMLLDDARPRARESLGKIALDQPYACVLVHMPGVGAQREAATAARRAARLQPASDVTPDEKGPFEEATPDMPNPVEAYPQEQASAVQGGAPLWASADAAGLVASLEAAPGEVASNDTDAPSLTAAMTEAMDAVSFACAIPIDGGVAAIADGFPEEQVLADPQGHALAVAEGSGDDVVFFDDLGGYVTWTLDDGATALAAPHLERILADSAGAARGTRPQLEVSWFMGSIAGALPEVFEAAEEAFASLDDSSEDLDELFPATDNPDGSPEMDAVLEAGRNMTAVARAHLTGLGDTYDRFRLDSTDQISLTAGVQPWGLHLGLAITPRSNDDANMLRKQAARTAGGVVSPTLVRKVPASSFAVWNSYTSPTYEDENMAKVFNMTCEFWSALVPFVERVAVYEKVLEAGPDTVIDPAVCVTAITDYANTVRATGTGHVAGFAQPVPRGVMGIGSLRSLSASARDGRRAMWSSLQLDKMVGPRLAALTREYLTLSYESKVRTVNGVEVDRASAGLTKKAIKKITKGIESEEDKKTARKFWQLIDATIGRSWSIEWAERDETEVTVFGFARTAEAMDETLAGMDGAGAMAADPGLTKATAHHPNASASLHLDASGLMGVVREWVSVTLDKEDAAEALAVLPADLPGDLSTLGMFGETRPSGHSGGQVVVGLDLIVDVALRVMMGSMGGGPPGSEQASAPVGTRI